jgi:hypothetical protein
MSKKTEKPAMTLKQIEAEVRRMDPNVEPGSDTFKTAVILLSALVVGANTRRVVAFTGYAKEEVEARATNLKQCGIWKGGKTHSDWDDPEHGGVAFWMDCCVADGMLKRA